MVGRITIKFDGRNGKVGEAFKRGVTRYSEAQTKALQRTAQRAAERMENAGRENIARAGNFKSARWQLGLRALVSYQSRTDLRIRVTHSVTYWRVFEYAPTRIDGKPLLWIPLDFANIPEGMRARDFPEDLFRVDRAGKAPLLISSTGPKYFGKEFVTITTKWDLRGVVRTVAKQMPSIYSDELRRAKANG